MQSLRALTAFYLQSSIHVALAVVCLIELSAGEFNTELPWSLQVFVFSAAVLGYNYVRYYPLDGKLKVRLQISMPWFVASNALAAIACVVSAIYLPTILYPWMLLAGAITFAYATPLMGRRNLRMRAGLKIILVALVWTIVTTWLPALMADLPLKGNVLFSMLQRFFLVILLTLPFEIRDLDDDDSSLGTLPQLLGLDGTRQFGLLLGIFIVALEFAKFEPVRTYTIVVIYMTVVAVLMLMLAKRRQSLYYAAFWVEGIPIGGWVLWSLLLI